MSCNRLLAGIVCLLLLSIGVFLIKDRRDSSHVPTSVHSATQEDTYPLLSRRIYRIPEQQLILNYVPLRKDLRTYIATQSGTVSVYFEYIPTGNSIAINDQIPFAFASLLKVPMAMAVQKKIATGQLHQTDELIITKETIDPNFGTLWEKGIGTKITVADALRLTLQESDNTAYQLLRTKITAPEFAAIFENLDIPLLVEGDQPVVTAKNLTSVFKSLFFSSSLTQPDSSTILDSLTHSTYTTGIRSDIPDSIKIAHKMGVREETKALYDCGIIYLPNKPYFLCVMTQNFSPEQGEHILQTISDKIYTFLK